MPMATQKSSLRAKQKEFTRQHVVQSALAVFDAKGFTAATIDDIAGEADLGRATIYFHFDNKTAILRAAVTELPELLPLLEAVLSAEDRSGRESAFAALHDYWRDHLGPVWRHVREAASTDEDMASWMLHSITEQTAMVQRAAERHGTARGRAKAGAFVMGCLWNEYAYRIGDATDGLTRTAAVAALADVYEAAVGIR